MRVQELGLGLHPSPAAEQPAPAKPASAMKCCLPASLPALPQETQQTGVAMSHHLRGGLHLISHPVTPILVITMTTAEATAEIMTGALSTIVTCTEAVTKTEAVVETVTMTDSTTIRGLVTMTGHADAAVALAPAATLLHQAGTDTGAAPGMTVHGMTADLGTAVTGIMALAMTVVSVITTLGIVIGSLSIGHMSHTEAVTETGIRTEAMLMTNTEAPIRHGARTAAGTGMAEEVWTQLKHVPHAASASQHELLGPHL